MSDEPQLTSMTISLPVSQKAYVREQAMACGCSTPSEFIRRLIHADQRARAQEELERRILEGLESPSRAMTPEAWKELREGLKAKLRDRRQGK
jgi:antitoxin ParD1/3/4